MPGSRISEGRQVFGTLSVEDNLRLAACYRSDAEADADLERQYELFPMLRERRNALASVLSGGQQQMLALGRGLMSAPKPLMLDEPSMGLAPQFVMRIFRGATGSRCYRVERVSCRVWSDSNNKSNSKMRVTRARKARFGLKISTAHIL